MAIVGYFAEVTEYEFQWGNRPDGFIIAIEKDDISRFVNTEECFKHNPRGDYCAVDTPKFCRLSEKAKEMIEKSNKNVVWVDRPQLKELVLEH